MTSSATTLKTLIVDDEPLAREGIRLLIEAEPDVVVVGECGNGAEAIESIQTLSPNLVFLDIKMPRVDGFEVIRTIGPEKMPAVVFLTAYDQHAVAAFRADALDYLLKPISSKRLQESLTRARDQIRFRELNKTAQQLRNLLDSESPVDSGLGGRIQIRSGGRVYFLRLSDVLSVGASGDYVSLQSENGEHLIRETMLNMERRLAPSGFRRIHRSTIVNLEYVSELIANDSGDYQVVLTNGKQLKLSRKYRDGLYAALNA